MSNSRTFTAFFSYAHEDADADPRLFDAFTTQLEKRINVRLVNDRFEIWRDKEGIRTGDRWNAKLESALRAGDILIVLLTPRWIGSEYCRKEYEIFEEVEAGRMVNDYVAGYIVPILARDTQAQKAHFNVAQNEVYTRISARQYQQALARDFLRLSKTDLTIFLDKISDDIEGMIERRRSLPDGTNSNRSQSLRVRRPLEFDTRAHNYEQVDFVKNAEVLFEQHKNASQQDIFAQLDFVERLYVQGKLGRIDFGIRRAILSLCNNGPGTLSRVNELKGERHHQNSYYITRHEAPDAISICMDPPPGRSSLAELALPPAPTGNYLSKVATAIGADAGQLTAELLVQLNAEGLHLTDDQPLPSQRTANKIKAIMALTATKAATCNGRSVDQCGQFRRKLTVRKQP